MRPVMAATNEYRALRLVGVVMQSGEESRFVVGVQQMECYGGHGVANPFKRRDVVGLSACTLRYVRLRYY